MKHNDIEMKQAPARFIVLEGLDGTGKSTQIKLLRQYYDKRNIPSYFIHFPRTDTESEVFGLMIAKFLRGDYGPLEHVHPELVALIYAGDRFNSTRDLEEKLDNGIHVFADRYVFSNIGFQCAKIKDQVLRMELLHWIFELEYQYFKIPQPDISVFLHVPIDFVEHQLKTNRTGDDRIYLNGKQDIHEQNLEFQKAVEQVYLATCKLMPDRLLYVNCISEQGMMMSPHEIHEKLLTLLSDKQLI